MSGWEPQATTVSPLDALLGGPPDLEALPNQVTAVVAGPDGEPASSLGLPEEAVLKSVSAAEPRDPALTGSVPQQATPVHRPSAVAQEAPDSLGGLPDQAFREGHFVATEFLAWESSESDRRYSPQSSSREAVAEVDLLGFADPLGAVSPGAVPPPQGKECVRDEVYESLI